MLLGRRSECEKLDRLLDAVRAGQSQALVVLGEPGLGKTALLDYASERATGCRVARAAGVQSEMELAFAALHQLCAPMLDRLESLPGPQRDALSVAFGLSAGNAPDRFLVGVAALSLLSEMAEEQPLVCVVDDAQWLDRASAQTLAFVARRLLAESIAVVFATREASADFNGLPELTLEGLGDAEARELFDSVIKAPIDERVRDRFVAETRGNPLALLELPHGNMADWMTGGFGFPDALPMSGRIEESFRRRIDALPAETQRALLVAAAEPLGEPVLVWRAAERLGIEAEAAAPATAAGLVEFGARVRFRHPLVRSAVYRAASVGERQTVHGALADATDPEVDPDRRAWHRAHATPGLDEDVAADLERSAGRAQARGGLAAAAAFLKRATELTPEAARRARRALAAAKAKHQAGAPDAALELLATAQAGPLDEFESARADVLRGQIAFAVNRGRNAPPLLLKAAKRLEPLDARFARDTYLDAFAAAIFAGPLASNGGVLEVAQAALAAPAGPQPARAADLMLDGLALRIAEGYAAGVPVLKRALSAFRGEEISSEQGLHWLWLASNAALYLWDDESLDVVSTRLAGFARDAGALTVLPLALSMRTALHVFAGELDAAASVVEEAEAVMEATGSQFTPYGALVLVAWQGREAGAAGLFEATMKDAMPRGEGIGLPIVQWMRAVLYNGLGRYDDARATAARASAHPEGLGFSTWVLPELIEAAVRSGTAELAANALQKLSDRTRASGTDWALGIEARSRALLSETEAAELLYREAIERLSRTRIRAELARAHLLYGEWLRRERRRQDAREQLRTAHHMFTTMGIEAFAQRAARELLATGESARKRNGETSGDLTPQEAQIARLARDGLSNPEIGSQLFISPRTVQYHLHKVFGKLEISSRTQLDRALTVDADVAQVV